jgi:hypothetical protein
MNAPLQYAGVKCPTCGWIHASVPHEVTLKVVPSKR